MAYIKFLLSIGIALLTFAALVPKGSGLKCYSYDCRNYTGIPEYASWSRCTPPKETNCSWYYTHCLTQRHTKAEFNLKYGKYLYTTEERRGCTDFASFSTKCHIPNSYCKSENRSGDVVSCNIGCCQKDLCNDGTLPPRVPEKTGPITGVGLSCFSCSSGGGLLDSPTRNCDEPVVVSCANAKSSKSNILNDRCMTVKAVKKFGSFREVINVRGCADPYYCNQDFACKYLNSSGNLESCNMSCCFGKNCNGPGKVPESVLSCYSCLTPKGSMEFNVADAECSAPAKQDCFYTDVNEPSRYENNRCVKGIVAFQEKKKSDLTTVEVRHCSRSASQFCNKEMLCEAYNKSGSLKRCDIACCSGNYCNDDAFLTPLTPSTQVPSSTVSTVKPSTPLLQSVITLLMSWIVMILTHQA